MPPKGTTEARAMMREKGKRRGEKEEKEGKEGKEEKERKRICLCI